ncbi:hypothetical protein BCR37DRAFT_393926 [Protomyces lactucae-debilis]|uniref:F-box domain-containing protein n=1 Tax=Protomyces lactucae-debilis TaxID=2754530 RepID=A0A1Y2F928_PROLT|nr:uncharacterized protein BCR37DRAFT_393926 [Protomyces lactucae-debilis]ORY79846.1 hypothetical protein BCR37DRAFT_393926 [Protomyces lactucae-debilis]
MLQELPDELLGEIVSLLDYRSVARLAQTSRSFAALASDALLWQHVYASTFDAPYRRDCASRTVEGVLGGLREPRGRTHKDKLKARLDALHAFLNYDTDLHCPTLLSLFYEMGEANAMVVSRCVAVKERKFEDREAECQAVRFELLCGGMPWQLARDFATKRNINLGNGHPQDIVKYFLSYPPGHGFEGRGRRQDLDPRSDYFLARMLFARQQGYRASPSFVHDMSSWTSSFLKASSMIVYDSIAYPLFHFPPHNIREPIRDHPMPRTLEDRARYHLRSGNRRPAPITATATCREPCVNWGVVETILQMVGLYKHGLPDLIPGLSIPRDCLEHEVPMEACMFDAGLAGHYRGVYAYLDFRELEHLDFGRPLAPDYFDGIQELVIEEEEAVEMFRPTATDPRADDQTAREGNTTDEDEDGEGEGWGESDHLDRLQDIPFRRFTANSHSRYHAHRHHIHGSSLQIPGYPAGFKVVRFESMFDEEHGLLPWIVEAVNIPSIGIVGRWRDRTEARGVAIEGPYVLWRDRVGDRIERERLVKLMTGSDVVAQDVMNEVTERYGMDAETLLAAWQKPDALARQVSPSSKAFERYIVVEATEV